MKTLVIKMNDLSPDAAGVNVYPVQLFFDDGQADWLTRPVATINLPEDLSIPNPPNDPATGQPLDGRQIRDAFVTQPTIFVEWGRYLHQLLFQGALAQEWDRLHQIYPGEVTEQSEGLRTILDIKPDTLRWLPWELILQDPLLWFFDPANPFSRGTLEKTLPTRSFTWPIHALIVVGSSKADEPEVHAEQEIEAIQHAFIKSPVPIDWHVCCQPTKTELKNLILKFKPQIFHFIGHGKQKNNNSYLELTDRTGGPTPQQWTVGDVSIDFLGWQPRFAFINACRSSSATGQENSWDIARAFANVGVPAVVGMQADIRGDAAAEFSGKFYESMVHGAPIDRSLAEARAAVKDKLSLGYRDWALATLYLQQLPEQILDIQPAIDKKLSNKFKIDGKLKDVNDFVGRTRQRREIWHGVDKIAGRDDEFKDACIVVGTEQIGKTALVQASMKVCALRNRRISYVDIDRNYQTTSDFVDVLNLIRAGDLKSGSIICRPLPTEPFEDFDNKYGPLLAQPDPDKILAADNNLCEKFFTAYKAALVAIAANEPLIIVLDHLSVEWEQFKSVLVPKLLVPIAEGSLPNCRLVLICTTTEYDRHLPDELKNLSGIIELTAWKDKEKYVPLARQMCLYNEFELKPQVEALIGSFAQFVESNWGPDNLRVMIDAMKRLSGVRK